MIQPNFKGDIYTPTGNYKMQLRQFLQSDASRYKVAADIRGFQEGVNQHGFLIGMQLEIDPTGEVWMQTVAEVLGKRGSRPIPEWCPMPLIYGTVPQALSGATNR